MITAEGVLCEKDGEQKLFPCDSVVYAVGQVPRSKETFDLAACAPEFYPIGDSIGPKNIMNATSQAYKVAMAIGTNL